MMLNRNRRDFRRHASGIPLAASGSPGPRDSQRVRHSGAGVRGGVQAAETVKWGAVPG